MSNRHGLIAGATGTGKTVTLQVMAEAFSRIGVPVFAADVKGDLSGVKAVRFSVKGDGKKYRLALVREAVTDYANFAKEFNAPSDWTQMEIPLSALNQADWGQKVDRKWNDVRALEFAALTAESSFDIRIDNVELVLEAGKSPPFGENAKAPDEPQTPIEGQFPERGEIVQLFRKELPRSDQHAQRDGQVVAAGLFTEVRGC